MTSNQADKLSPFSLNHLLTLVLHPFADNLQGSVGLNQLNWYSVHCFPLGFDWWNQGAAGKVLEYNRYYFSCDWQLGPSFSTVLLLIFKSSFTILNNIVSLFQQGQSSLLNIFWHNRYLPSPSQQLLTLSLWEMLTTRTVKSHWLFHLIQLHLSIFNKHQKILSIPSQSSIVWNQ